MSFYCNIQHKFSKGEHLQIEISLNQADILHLKGRNASGKTTIFNLINGFLIPTSGRIVLNDRVLFDSDKNINIPTKNRNISCVFQNHYLFPNMNVNKNLNFANKDSNLLKNLIDKLDLAPLLKKYPRNLSGGQQQKLAVVQSLINNPKLLLLDEAFSNLDIFTRDALKEIILDRNIPTILTTHSLEDTKNFITKTISLF